MQISGKDLYLCTNATLYGAMPTHAMGQCNVSSTNTEDLQVGMRRSKRVSPQIPIPPKKLNSQSWKVFVVSDLHTDYAINLEWVRQLSSSFYEKDTLLVAGDISEHLKTFTMTMSILKEKFGHVFFVPGNHDLWCRHGDDKQVNSLDKFEALLKICNSLGVQTTPKRIREVLIVPLLSWYHKSFDKERDITGFNIPSLKKACIDYWACKWSSGLETDDSLAQFFDEMNSKHIENVQNMQSDCSQVITFSHFLPRQELCPEKRMLSYPNLPKIIGSDLLEARLRSIHGPNGTPTACHVFGHTHFCWDATLNGIRYIQAPLAYPNERQRRMNGGEDWLPLCIYDSEHGLIDGTLPCYWSDYYHSHKREPQNIELSPWVAQLYRKVKT